MGNVNLMDKKRKFGLKEGQTLERVVWFDSKYIF